MRNARVWILFCALLLRASSAGGSESDSLQLKLYHGLDELGGGAVFARTDHIGAYWSKWIGGFNTLQRSPLAALGDEKQDAALNGEIGRRLNPNFDLEAIFRFDRYQFRPFRGPEPIFPTSVSPPGEDGENETTLYNTGSLNVPSTKVLQRIDRTTLGIGGEFHPDTLFNITAVLGQNWDQREGFDDRGLSASLDAALQNLEYKGYHNDLNLFIEQVELGKRLNRDLQFRYGLFKVFSQNSSDRLLIQYRQKRSDYHVWNTQSIGTRLDSDQMFQNQLRYDFAGSFGILVDMFLNGSRHEDRSGNTSTIRDEINTATAFTLNGDFDHFRGWFRTRLEGGTQEDATGLKHERGTSLEQGLCWLPNRSDSLEFSSAVRKKKYDTSDTSNFDDRDRLRYEMNLFYGHVFTPRFRIGNQAQVILEHLVYIFGEKSDQNNWNRIFKLSPEISFIPAAGVENLARFELVANTTDYDFELDPAFIKSTIYRRYTFSDSVHWGIRRGWKIIVEYAMDLEDGGRLLWDDWIQQISEEYRTHRATFRFCRETQAGILFESGFSLYERKGWDYDQDPAAGSVKIPFAYLLRFGPLLQLSYPSASGMRLDARGDLSWVHEWGSDDYTIVNLDLRVTWR
jgi:hypothetical protein